MGRGLKPKTPERRQRREIQNHQIATMQHRTAHHTRPRTTHDRAPHTNDTAPLCRRKAGGGGSALAGKLSTWRESDRLEKVINVLKSIRGVRISIASYLTSRPTGRPSIVYFLLLQTLVGVSRAQRLETTTRANLTDRPVLPGVFWLFAIVKQENGFCVQPAKLPPLVC